jgi:hypothetical protein
MNEAHGADEPPIPHEVVPRLTEVAARLAADHADPQPTSVAAVATTRAKASEVVMGYRARPFPGELGAEPVYVITMSGRFESVRGGPPSTGSPLVGSYLTVIVEAATLQLRLVGVGDRNPHARLSRLAPVTRLAW